MAFAFDAVSSTTLSAEYHAVTLRSRLSSRVVVLSVRPVCNRRPIGHLDSVEPQCWLIIYNWLYTDGCGIRTGFRQSANFAACRTVTQGYVSFVGVATCCAPGNVRVIRGVARAPLNCIIYVALLTAFHFYGGKRRPASYWSFGRHLTSI